MPLAYSSSATGQTTLPGRECSVPRNRRLQIQWPPSSENIRGNLSPPDQLFPPSDAGEGHRNVPLPAALESGGLRPRPEARSTEHDDDQGDLRRQRVDGPPSRSLQDEDPNETSLETKGSIATVIDRFRQVETNNDLDFPPSLPDTIHAAYQLSGKKAPDSDAIPVFIYKHGGHRLLDQLTALFQKIWRQGQVPQGPKEATTVHLQKLKRNWRLCDNHRSISLLNISGNIFVRLLPNRLNSHLE
ncbi:hypothetical protein SprV_0902709000 [Sparganum proliferum]